MTTPIYNSSEGYQFWKGKCQAPLWLLVRHTSQCGVGHSVGLSPGEPQAGCAEGSPDDLREGFLFGVRSVFLLPS